MKKKILALALVVCLLGVAVVSSTLAYFTDSEQATNVFTVGNIDIELTEEAGVYPSKADADADTNEYEGRVVMFEDNSAAYSNVMPTNYLQKEVTVTNTGRNAAYVRVAVIVGNFPELLAAVDDYYENKTIAGKAYPKNGAEIEAIYDEIFAGWGVTYQKTAADNTVDNDLRAAINVEESDVYAALNGKTDAQLIGIDTYRTTCPTIRDGYELLTSKNNTFGLKGTNNNFPNTDDITGAILGEYELMYVYYLLLEEGASATLFNGLNVPAYFNNEQMDFFENLQIEIYADAIQVEGLADAETAFDNLAQAHPLASIERPTTSSSRVEASEDFKAAATEDKEIIYIELTEDVTYDVAAWAVNGMGGASTKDIIINGNGHTITFYQTNSDWNNIVTNNGATLTITNAKITNSGHNDGPWNRHDLNFGCDVVLTNVVSDKAIALKAGGQLTNVTINDANDSDTYALWIQPNGQTVTLDGCTIDMLDCTDGRGIKIDEQYLSAPEKVTLTVKNTVFKTEEKSAILVKSAAGADIILENVDITAVVTDSTNPVWVDEASAAYADLVTVTGGTKILEP